MYKLSIMPPSTTPTHVIRSDTNGTTSIPFVSDNTDYQEYLKWVEEGNTPEPADE